MRDRPKTMGEYRQASAERYHRWKEERGLGVRLRYDPTLEERLNLKAELHKLGRIEQRAHEAGPDRLGTMEALAMVYKQRPEIERKLDELEGKK